MVAPARAARARRTVAEPVRRPRIPRTRTTGRPGGNHHGPDNASSVRNPPSPRADAELLPDVVPDRGRAPGGHRSEPTAKRPVVPAGANGTAGTHRTDGTTSGQDADNGAVNRPRAPRRTRTGVRRPRAGATRNAPRAKGTPLAGRRGGGGPNRRAGRGVPDGTRADRGFPAGSLAPRNHWGARDHPGSGRGTTPGPEHGSVMHRPNRKRQPPLPESPPPDSAARTGVLSARSADCSGSRPGPCAARGATRTRPSRWPW